MGHQNQIDLVQDSTYKKFKSCPPVLLKNFSSQELRSFLNTGVIEKCSSGTFVFSEGQTDAQACLIVDGTVSVWREEVQIGTLRSGDCVGETFLFIIKKCQTNIIAEEETTLIRFERDKILEFFRGQPERLFNLFIMNVINVQHQKIQLQDKKFLTLQKLYLKQSNGVE